MNDDDLNRWAEHQRQRDMARSKGCFWILIVLALAILLTVFVGWPL